MSESSVVVELNGTRSAIEQLFRSVLKDNGALFGNSISERHALLQALQDAEWSGAQRVDARAKLVIEHAAAVKLSDQICLTARRIGVIAAVDAKAQAEGCLSPSANNLRMTVEQRALGEVSSPLAADGSVRQYRFEVFPRKNHTADLNQSFHVTVSLTQSVFENYQAARGAVMREVAKRGVAPEDVFHVMEAPEFVPGEVEALSKAIGAPVDKMIGYHPSSFYDREKHGYKDIQVAGVKWYYQSYQGGFVKFAKSLSNDRAASAAPSP